MDEHDHSEGSMYETLEALGYARGRELAAGFGALVEVVAGEYADLSDPRERQHCLMHFLVGVFVGLQSNPDEDIADVMKYSMVEALREMDDEGDNKDEEDDEVVDVEPVPAPRASAKRRAATKRQGTQGRRRRPSS